VHRRRFDLLLQVRENRLSGVGNDDTGMFVLSGEYDPRAEEFRWVLTHMSGETVQCRGFFGTNHIWGTWQDGSTGHGGFQIWPLKPEAASSEPHVGEVQGKR